MSKQYGFYYDASRCIQCRTCELACKVTNNTEPGVKWRRVIETWGGNYPDVTRAFFSLACMHCEEPACVTICPTEAIHKRVEDGIVVVDKNKCNGCQDCFTACPYGVPQFGKDGKMQKCDYCTEISREPACVESCPAEALYYGVLDELLEMATGKNVKRMDGTTKPSMIIIN
jgi:anaerobic dimethyl sulfoxide reductase subunit B (iron-sulfur subunit)